MAFGKKKDADSDKAAKKEEKKAKKQQKKEEKQAKKQEKKAAAGQDAEGGKKSKKKLLLLILAVAALGAGFRFGLMDKFTGGGGGKSAIPQAVDAYELDGESVPSLTAALTDVGDELLLSMSGNGLPAEEDAEDAEGDAAAPQATDDAEDVPLHSNYYYKITEDTAADLESYAAYLTAAAEEGAGFTLRGGSEDYVTAYERDAAEHSKQLVILEIENPLNGDAETGMFAIKLHLEQKQEQEKLQEGVTRDQAMQYFMGLDYQTLGLEKPVSEYYLVMDMGRTYIDKNDCYGINLYNKGEGEESYFVKKFYLSLEHKKLYEYLAGDLVGLQDNYTVNHLVSSNQSDADESSLDAMIDHTSTPKQ